MQGPRRVRRSLCAVVGVVGLAATFWFVAAPAGATTVSTEAELRDAFGDVNETQIDLANDITLIDCGAGALQRNSPTGLIVHGHGFTIRQTCDDRVMNQDSTGTLTLRRVTVTGGNTSGGGGGVNTNGDVTVENSAILNNQAGDASGGGISAANVTMTGSTVAGNSTTNAPGGGIGALNQRLVNSTVTNNRAGGDENSLAGGLFTGNGEIVLVYSDLVGNTAKVGANINEFSGGATFTSFGSVVARPLGGGGNCVLGSVKSEGFNFSDDDSCKFTEATDRQNAGDPLLGALADNGGPTPTLLPQTGSPLIDAIPVGNCQDGDAAGITTDQRGLPRPAMNGCDIGSVEVQPPAPPSPPPAPIVPAEPRFTG